MANQISEDHDPDRISTRWMPERMQVAAHAHSLYGTLRGIEEADDVNGRRDMLLVGYGSTEACVRMIVDCQGREAALALLAEYTRAIHALKTDDAPMPSAVLN